MKMPIRFLERSSWFVMVLLVSTPSFPARASNRMQIEILHPSLGETIDSLKNGQYNIFGRIPGFSAGRLYKTGDQQYRLHLIRNREGRAQMRILEMSLRAVDDFRSKTVRYIQEVDREKQPPDDPVFPIDGSIWNERYLTQKVVLRDGNEILGILVHAKRDTLTVKTPGGLSIPIPDSNIQKIGELRREIHQGQWVRFDPNGSRLFFAPTGRSLNPGSGYFADYYVFFPTLAVGITDFLSLSGGVSLFPGLRTQLFYFAPKITMGVSTNAGISTGFLTLSIPEEKAYTLGYAVTTFGSERRGITLGAGMPVNRDSDRHGILLVGGESQISNSAKVITENWIFLGNGSTVLMSGGIRFFSDRLTVDLALVTVNEMWEEGFPFIPYVDFAVFFGK